MRRFLRRPAAGLAALLLLLSSALPLRAEDKPANEAAKAPAASAAALLPPDAVTHHKLTLGNQEIAYPAAAGTLPLRDDKGEKQADIFYVAFLRDGVADAAKRPITYAFNGGPGAASAYLHICPLGPRALHFRPPRNPPPPPHPLGHQPPP